MQQLNQEDMKLYFVVLYTTQLLMEHTKQMHSPNSSDLYYFTHLIKMIQQLKEWHDITQKGQSVSYVSLKKTLKNNSHPWLSTEHVFDQPRLIQHSHMLYYPLLRPHLISERALSILTLYHLSLICLELHEGDVRDVVKRLMLYITEGLMDMNSRQQFQRMLNQQPKSRISQWKKKVKSGEMAMVMKMRPCLLKEEEALLMPLLRQSEQMHDLIEALETNDSLFTSILYFP
ncbi:hypothetical protein EDC96DRAFT_286402 [Choanephora cucurbitarum]|nr:hypothetical protein EDC96DRAFT_286402 [Choanephora cucurbitarum]